MVPVTTMRPTKGFVHRRSGDELLSERLERKRLHV
jgi:hypothetical protein